jgi:hypothetical protein
VTSADRRTARGEGPEEEVSVPPASCGRRSTRPCRWATARPWRCTSKRTPTHRLPSTALRPRPRPRHRRLRSSSRLRLRLCGSSSGRLRPLSHLLRLLLRAIRRARRPRLPRLHLLQPWPRRSSRSSSSLRPRWRHRPQPRLPPWPPPRRGRMVLRRTPPTWIWRRSRRRGWLTLLARASVPWGRRS